MGSPLMRSLLLAPLLLPLLGLSSAAQAGTAPEPCRRCYYYPDRPQLRDPELMRVTMLRGHNRERSQWRVPALRWDEDLAADAEGYARELARTGTLRHSDRSSRPRPEGENLWMGVRGAFTYEDMVDTFLDERRYYVSRPLPDISSTGNWHDVGHYSQIIWRSTTAFGCGLASNDQFDFLVCRYNPPGNVYGQRADVGDGEAAVSERALASRDDRVRPSASLSYGGF